MPATDLTGQRFGRLLVISRAADASSRNLQFNCQCDCGQEVVVRGTNIRLGKTRSCGCLSIEMTAKRKPNLSHGHAAKRSGTYHSWRSMMERCYREKHPHYASYGGKGIGVVLRWHSFENFLSDMGERPSGTTLDRVDGAMGYAPSNCRWATRQQQQRNLRSNHRLTVGGVTKCVAEWSQETGLKETTIRQRKRRGWPDYDAVRVPVNT